MQTNLKLIIDAESAFTRTKVEETYQQWGYTRSNVKERTAWTAPQTGKTLFGDKMMIHLNLEDKNDMKNFVKLLGDKHSKDLFTKPDWFGNGLVITCSTAQGAKKIQDLTTKSNGTIVKKESKQNRKAEILAPLAIPEDTKKLVDYFVGEDYQLLLSFTNEMKKLNHEEQGKITTDNVLTYFPPTPGSTLPWEFMTPLLEGDTEKAIHEFERTIKNTHVLVPMMFLQRNITTLVKIAFSRLEIPNNPKELATAIGEKPYGAFWSIYNVAKRTSLTNVKQIAIETTTLENNLKGNSKVDDATEFKATLAKIGLLLNH